MHMLTVLPWAAAELSFCIMLLPSFLAIAYLQLACILHWSVVALHVLASYSADLLRHAAGCGSWCKCACGWISSVSC